MFACEGASEGASERVGEGGGAGLAGLAGLGARALTMDSFGALISCRVTVAAHIGKMARGGG